MQHGELREPHRFQQLNQPLFGISLLSNDGELLRSVVVKELVHFQHHHRGLTKL